VHRGVLLASMTFLLFEIFLEPARGLTKGIRQVYNLVDCSMIAGSFVRAT